MSCKYSESLGIPGKGAHSYGAALDWILTIIMSIIIGTIIWHFEKNKSKIPLGFSIFICFLSIYLLAIFLHWVFCVKSRVSIFLGLI